MIILFDNIIFSLQKSGGFSVYWAELLSRIAENTAFEKFILEIKSAHNTKFREALADG